MKMKTCSSHAPPVDAVRCVWCGKTYLLCKAHAAMFTGCAKDCRANIVRLLNRLWKTKLGSEEEAQILGRLRNPPEPEPKRKRRKEARHARSVRRVS